MVKSADRTLDILEILAEAPDGLSHTGIARALGIPKSSLTELLRNLTARGYLVATDGGGQFAIGPRVLPLARAFLERLDLVREVGPITRQLRDELGEAVTLAVLQGNEIVVIGRESARRTLAPVMRVGDRAPALLTASGKALAAFLDTAAVDRMADALARSTPDMVLPAATRLRQELAQVRSGGFAATIDGWVPGVAAIGLPVFTAEDAGVPAASIAVALPTVRLNDKSRAEIERALRAAAREATDRMGGTNTVASAAE